MSRRALVLFVLAALTLARLARVGATELSPDEAYYLLWSERLDWAYFSKGPGVALAIRASTALLGDSEVGVRALAPLLALATSLLLLALAQRLFDAAVADWTVVALQVIPLFNVGALIMTIDALSIAAWTATLLLAWLALDHGRARWWLATGVACGLGVLCKYTNALALPGLLLAAAWWPHADRGARARALRGVALAGVVTVALALPCVAWNARHGWPTLRHLWSRGGLDAAFALRPSETIEFVGAHFAAHSPLLFLAVVLAVPAAWRAARAGEARARYLLATSAAVLVPYAALALHDSGEANWTAPGVLGLLPLAVATWLPRARASRAGARAFALAALATGALLSVAVVETDLVRAAGIDLPARRDPSTRVRGWGETAREVGKVQRRLARARGITPLVVADHYGLASELAFYSGGPRWTASGAPSVHVVPTAEPRNQFGFWPGLRHDLAPGMDAVVLSRRAGPVPRGIEDLFEDGCTALPPIVVTRPRAQEPLRTLHLHACIGAR